MKVNGKIIENMDLDMNNSQINPIIMESSLITDLMDMDVIYGVMANYMKVSGLMVKSTVKVDGQVYKVINILVNGAKVSRMVRGYMNGLTVIDMRESLVIA